MRTKFERELEELINRHSQEDGSNTQDFILARFLASSLEAFGQGVRRRDLWYGKIQEPGQVEASDV